jgi:hypothetical protein
LILANLGRDAEAKEAVVRPLRLNLIFLFLNSRPRGILSVSNPMIPVDGWRWRARQKTPLGPNPSGVGQCH